MRFQLDELDVFFPYDYLYPEQFSHDSGVRVGCFMATH